jgi:Cu/Ag efflux protein CusF
MNTPRLHWVFALGWLSLVGCVSYQMPPLATSHPAHPDAPAAPSLPASRTLAYTPADIPRLQPAASAHPGAGQAESARSQTVIGEGSVVATVPAASQIVLDHEAIKDFMEAMTMGYRVEPPKLLDGLKPGDRVRFTIDVQKRTITAIEPLR